MDINYLDTAVDRVVHLERRQQGWSDAEIARLRLIVQCLQASKHVADMLSLRSLRLSLDPDDPQRATAELSAARTVTIAFKDGDGRTTAVIDIAPNRMDLAR